MFEVWVYYQICVLQNMSQSMTCLFIQLTMSWNKSLVLLKLSALLIELLLAIHLYSYCQTKNCLELPLEISNCGIINLDLWPILIKFYEIVSSLNHFFTCASPSVPAICWKDYTFSLQLSLLLSERLVSFVWVYF